MSEIEITDAWSVNGVVPIHPSHQAVVLQTASGISAIDFEHQLEVRMLVQPAFSIRVYANGQPFRFWMSTGEHWHQCRFDRQGISYVAGFPLLLYAPKKVSGWDWVVSRICDGHGICLQRKRGLWQVFCGSIRPVGIVARVLVTDGIPTWWCNPLDDHLFAGSALGGDWCNPFAPARAGVIGYCLAALWGFHALGEWMDRKFPGKVEYLEEKGAIGVAALAALPIPITVGTWLGGAFKVKPWAVLLAVAVRLPKVVIFLWVIMGGLKAESESVIAATSTKPNLSS